MQVWSQMLQVCWKVLPGHETWQESIENTNVSSFPILLNFHTQAANQQGLSWGSDYELTFSLTEALKGGTQESHIPHQLTHHTTLSLIGLIYVLLNSFWRQDIEYTVGFDTCCPKQVLKPPSPEVINGNFQVLVSWNIQPNVNLVITRPLSLSPWTTILWHDIITQIRTAAPSLRPYHQYFNHLSLLIDQ